MFADENCTEFTFSGYNTWQVWRSVRKLMLLPAAAWLATRHLACSACTGWQESQRTVCKRCSTACVNCALYKYATRSVAEAAEALVCGTVRTQLLENAASFLGSQQDVVTQFQAAIASNLTVVRMFGHGVASGFYLQNPAAMGTYNEQAFRAFDYVLDQAARHQLKLVISFADNWDTDSNSDNKCARPPTSALGIPAFLE